MKRIYYLVGMVPLIVLTSCSPTNVQKRPIGSSAGDLQTEDSYIINLNPDDCDVDIEEKLGKSSIYQEELDEKKGLRKITINSVASHKVGAFPNPGNPNTIKEHKMSFSVPLNPEVAKKTTNAQGFDSGVLFSGVNIDPYTAEFFIGTDGRMNPRWNITTLTSTENLGLDCNNAHVQPTGKYHYHGTPSAYLFELGADGNEMMKVGYAADGFPIYYKYGYDKNGNIVANESGYRLKPGDRPGDGKTAPNGTYNGRYFNDYLYIGGVSELDACNGRWGKTPDSENEYYYVITDNFPSVPLCFSGTPSAELNKRMGNGRPPGPPGGRRGNGGPPPGGARGRGGNSADTE